MTQTDDSSASGYISDSFEGISGAFTDNEPIYVGKVNFVCRAKRYGRWWALKGLREGAGEAERQQLRKEFEILSGLTHPGVVGPIGLEDVDKLGACIVMEYVEGMTLTEWLASRPSKHRRRSVACQIMEAVRYVHSKNIVHRDLKPSNILVAHNGDAVKLIDFGLADTDSHTILKQSGGTRGYISPEQAEFAEPDVRNDIYSLGVILGKMKIGYGRITRRCLRPIDKRYRNAADMLQAMKVRDRLYPRLMWATALIALAVVGFMGWTEMRHVRNSNYANTATNDSLRIVIDERDAVLEMQQARIDSFSHAAAVRNQKDSLFTKAANEGFAILRQSYALSEQKKHVDTLSQYAYYKGNLEVRPVSYELMEAIDDYVGRLNSFNDMERSQIQNMMVSYAQGLVNQINNKLDRLKKQND